MYFLFSLAMVLQLLEQSATWFTWFKCLVEHAPEDGILSQSKITTALIIYLVQLPVYLFITQG